MKRVVLLGLGLGVFLWTVIPFYWIANLSLMFNRDIMSLPTPLIPQDLTLSNYIRMLGQPAPGSEGQMLGVASHSKYVLNGLKNSFVIAMGVMALTLVIALPAAYAFGRLEFKRKFRLLFGILFLGSVPAIAIAVPLYYLFIRLRLTGTIHGLIIAYITLTVPFIVWIMMGFFAALPRTLEREARADGCTRFQAFYKVVLPAARPGVAVCGAIAFMVGWNQFELGWVLAAGSAAQPLPAALSGMFYIDSERLEAATATVLSIIPPIIVAYLFQSRIRRLYSTAPF